MEFVIGGAAAVCAGFFSNPLEVLKTRMQLQGELQAKGKHAVYYKNVLHAGYMVAKHDGILALQKGLNPALWVQFVLNGVRLGIYQFAEDKGFTQNEKGETVFYKSALAGGVGGVAGQYLCNPFYLVKTHLQSQSTTNIAVGHQHNHTGTLSALVNISKEHGIKGLFRGAGASIPRIIAGSVSQLTSFKYSKEWLNTYDYFRDKPLLTSFIGSLIGGIAISITITPFDLILTRIQNQPVDVNGKGKLYYSYMDCVLKIYKFEGASAFYKGVGPNYLRLGPHTLLCLVFWDEFTSIYNNYFPQ